MKASLASIGLLVVFIALWVAGNACSYVVPEYEQVVLTQFGAPVGKPVTAAGLHFKTPFVQTVNRLDKRILEWDGDPNEISTRDKLYISVETFGRWRIADPLLFFQRLRAERDAQSRLDDILDGETRNVIAQYDLVEIIRTSNREPEIDPTLTSSTQQLVQLRPISEGRAKIEQKVFTAASKRLTDLGIELLDIRLKRINYNPTVQADVYDRMKSERKQIADKFRSEGEGEAARIKGQEERDLKRIQSEAYLKTQQVRGKADAEAADIYAKAYNQGPEASAFYGFMKTLETYELTLDPNTTLILTTDSDLLRLLKSSGAMAAPPAIAPPVR